MPTENVQPARLQVAVKRAFERGRRYRRARAMFIKEYVGQYYNKQFGLTGDQPINLLYLTIRSLVPNLVVRNPVNKLETKILAQQPYGELLGLALDQVQQDIGLADILRGWVVSALFGWGIVKTSLSASGELLQFGDVRIDPGQIYTAMVDLDDYVLDPVCTHRKKAAFEGDRIRVPRQLLLDTDGYDHDLIVKLPHARYISDSDRVENISKQSQAVMEMNTLQDFVEVIELWIPEADALVTIPDPMQTTFSKYLRVADYNGPKEGPYTDLSFTPPVENNPYPVAPASIWYDIHRAANRIFKKLMDQADRQRDILMYSPAQADEAADILDAADGDSIATIDPNGVKVLSYGGQNRQNEFMMQQLHTWYNYMSGNTDQMAGNMPAVSKGKETATRSQILQGNANISLEDARSILYAKTAEISGKQAWYLHTDPLIELPLTKRSTGGQQVQMWLTPEQRYGDFFRFTFKIVARSMSRLDPAIKSKRIVEFATSLVPALMTAAMSSMQMGVPFNVQRAITDLASELDVIDTVQDWFNDPEFAQKMQIMAAMGPQNAGKAGTSSGGGGGGEGTNSLKGILQNGQSPVVRNIATPNQEFNQQSQETAAESQSANQGSYI